MQHLNTFRRFYMVYFQTALNHQGPKNIIPALWYANRCSVELDVRRPKF